MSGSQRILVSGASGVLGRQILALASHTYELHALVRTMPKLPLAGVHYHLVDFTSAWNDSALPGEIDAVWHFAQSPHMREYPEKAQEIDAVNLHAAERLLAYADRAQASHIVFTSTGGLYGRSAIPLDEHAPIAIEPGPLAYYFHTKHESERMLAAYGDRFHSCILRPFFIYGPGQPASMLIPRLIANIRQGIALSLQGKDGMLFNPIHAADAAQAVVATLGLQGQHIMNLAGPEIVSIRSAGEHIAGLLGTRAYFDHMEGDAPMLVATIDAMCRSLYTPQIRFMEGIRSLIEDMPHD